MSEILEALKMLVASAYVLVPIIILWKKSKNLLLRTKLFLAVFPVLYALSVFKLGGILYDFLSCEGGTKFINSCYLYDADVSWLVRYLIAQIYATFFTIPISLVLVFLVLLYHRPSTQHEEKQK